MRSRGALRCGTKTNDDLFGLAQYPNGSIEEWSGGAEGEGNTWKGMGTKHEQPYTVVGFDADLCRAVAAAIFGAEDVEEHIVWVNADLATTRFYHLNAGEYELMCRQSTQSIGKNLNVGVEFSPTVFYDGQVRRC